MAYIIRIFFNKRAYSVLVKEFVVIIVALVFLYMKRYYGSHGFFVARLYGVAVRTFGGPAKRLVRLVGAAFNRNLIAYHKRRIKAYAELTYNINVFFFLVFLLKGKRTGLCNGAEVLVKLFLGHTAAVIDNL